MSSPGPLIQNVDRIDPETLYLGIDVGSTTVKVVCVNSENGEILWKDYRRHNTLQAETLLSMLEDLQSVLPFPLEGREVLITGSGAGPLVEPLGARFIQEVNAVTLAVEVLHPDVESVVELGGQDAKIIVFRKDEKTGEKQAFCSMNDKCASGTGATIDKCLIKVGLKEDQLSEVKFNPEKLHKVAAKCGVFAETDIVNLIKVGIPSDEVICSLADAIVMQNISVLARGYTLRPKVLLLGGPNFFLPFLRESWRLRLKETWDERGIPYPKDVPLEELVFAPKNAQYYAAYGSVLYGIEEKRGKKSSFRGLQPLKEYVKKGRVERLKQIAGPPLINSQEELEEYRKKYTIPPFEPAKFSPGQVVEGVIGLDGGSTSSKAVLLDMNGEVLAKAYKLSDGNPLADMKDLLRQLRDYVQGQGAELKVAGFGVTGYAADIVEETVKADVKIVETIAHMLSAVKYFGEIDVICDIGGQDIKVLFLQNGEIRDFSLSNQCSAGNGMLLQAMAEQFSVPLEQYAEEAFKAELTPIFSYGCAVFLDTDRVNFQKEGFKKSELLAGLAMVLPKNVWQYVVQVPRLAELGRRYVLQGGTQKNLAAVIAQVKYITERVPDAEIFVHPHSGEAGAIGAALEALRVVRRRGHTTFIGLEPAINLHYTTRNDESTRCHFCPNLCSRTFIDAKTPDGRTSRYIAGFSCEKGTVESEEAMREIVRKRKELKKKFVNLAEYESKLAFRAFYKPNPLPEDGSPVRDYEVKVTWLGRKLKPIQRPFRRSPREAEERRKTIRIGIPRVLNIYSTAPFWRTYFQTLGIPVQNVVFSDYTSETLFRQGAKYGSVDPCFPAKVVQAHIHNLLFEKHPKRPLNYIFFPSITNLPSFLTHTVDNTSCPVVAGTPAVIAAAFKKEKDFFAERGIDYIFAPVTLEEVLFLKKQMFQIWGERLQITKDESDFAVDQAFQAMKQFEREMQRRGLEVLEQVERENRVALLLLGRPYHLDPGINHGILEEFQALGYPILTIRSIPKDPVWLSRWFGEDLREGRISDPFDIRDVWPENYSTNSAQKVWAAKFAARHPNVAMLDLSNFKCGHDAPTYGIIDKVVKAAKKPYMALHDIDANKPSGSFAIRVKTYAYSLKRYEEFLQDRAEKLSELERRLEEKRRELWLRHFEAEQQALAEDQNWLRTKGEFQQAFDEFLEEQLSQDITTEMEKAALKTQLRMDIAPQPPKEYQLFLEEVGKKWRKKLGGKNPLQ